MQELIHVAKAVNRSALIAEVPIGFAERSGCDNVDADTFILMPTYLLHCTYSTEEAITRTDTCLAL